jgi:hypothetical protein
MQQLASNVGEIKVDAALTLEFFKELITERGEQEEIANEKRRLLIVKEENEKQKNIRNSFTTTLPYDFVDTELRKYKTLRKRVIEVLVNTCASEVLASVQLSKDAIVGQAQAQLKEGMPAFIQAALTNFLLVGLKDTLEKTVNSNMNHGFQLNHITQQLQTRTS